MAKKLAATTEPKNPNYKFVAKVLKDNKVVGHIPPRDLMKYCTSALLCGGTVECMVIGKRENKWGSGLEAPCKYIVKGPKCILTNIACMMKYYLG